MRIAIIALAALLCIATPAQAQSYTCGKFASDETSFATGFAWGVVSMWLAFPGIETQENIDKISECLEAGEITSGILQDAVLARIANNPSLLPKSAQFAVLETLYAMCPVR